MRRYRSFRNVSKSGRIFASPPSAIYKPLHLFLAIVDVLTPFITIIHPFHERIEFYFSKSMRDTRLTMEEHLPSAFLVLKRLLTAIRERTTMGRMLTIHENCE
jgi:hypothetical protein